MDSRKDGRIAAIAAGQHGVVTVRQLRAAGLDTAAIKRRVRAGRLHRLHRGVYLVRHPGSPVAPELAAEYAAVLACGSDSLVSHSGAARVWALPPFRAWTGPVEVTVVGRVVPGRPGLIVHRARALDRRDFRRVRGVPVTAPARTLYDLAARLPPDELEVAFADALARRLVRNRDLTDILERRPGRRGAKAFRQVLELDGGHGLIRSKAEGKLLPLLNAADLPVPNRNARAGRAAVDFLWRDRKLVVEVDGYAFHSGRESFESDRERDARLAADGYLVLRVTWRQITETPEAVIARIAATLAVRAV